MQVQCSSCGTTNNVGPKREGTHYQCGNCSAPLPDAPEVPEVPESNGETSAAVGLLGGAALGAALGGPVGAIIGGIVGGILGKNAKGVG